MEAIKKLNIFELKILLIEIQRLLEEKEKDFEMEIKKHNIQVEQNWANLYGIIIH